jgi:hypothetical protein
VDEAYVRRGRKRNSHGRIVPRWEDDIKMDFKEVSSVSIGFIWLRIKTSGGFL